MPAFYQRPPAPDMATTPNSQPATLYQQLRQENASFNQTAQAGYGSAGPGTPVRMHPPRPDYSQQQTPDTSCQHTHMDNRNNESTEVVSTELNRVRRTHTLQLKTASKAQDNLRLQPSPSISNTNTDVRKHQPEALIFEQTHSPPPATMHPPVHHQQTIVISSGRQLPIAIFDNLNHSQSQSSTRPDTSPIRKAYGDRNTPVKDAIIHARDASPAPTIPHGHFRIQASPDTSVISSSRDPYRPLLTAKNTESGQLVPFARLDSNREA
jgi:hypothetical protein